MSKDRALFFGRNDAVLGGSDALRNASADDLRVLLCLYEDGTRDVPALAEAAGCSQSRASGAIQYWREAGVIGNGGGSNAVLRSLKYAPYTRSAEELAETIDRNDLRHLTDGCTELLGHTPNQSEITEIVGLIEKLGLDTGYILTLLQYCKEIGRGSIAYMTRTAAGLVDQGVGTLKALEDYIKQKNDFKTVEGLVRRLFGLGGRAFSSAEKEAVNRWRLYGYGEDIIGYAYDLTVSMADKPTIMYADKIIKGFYENGCHTLEACKEQREKERVARASVPGKGQKPQKKGLETHTFDTGDFFKKALERSYGKTDGNGEEPKS